MEFYVIPILENKDVTPENCQYIKAQIISMETAYTRMKIISFVSKEQKPSFVLTRLSVDRHMTRCHSACSNELGEAPKNDGP